MAFRPLLDHLQHLTLSFEGDDTVDSEDSDEEELTFPLIGEVLDEVAASDTSTSKVGGIAIH
eukprot:gene4657-4990_t